MAGRGAGLSGGAVRRVYGVHAVAVLVGAVRNSDRLRSGGDNDRNNIMKTPIISVITPSRNSGAFLEDAILSVAQQEGVQAEHIVQDSLSSDNTLEILRRHPETRWQWESDNGQSDAINRGFLRAQGELVGWLNADDYYLPGGLKAIAQAAAAHPEADVFHGDCV